MKQIAVIGLGLIGGSLALDFKDAFDVEVLGIDGDLDNAKKSLSLGVIDRIVSLQEINDADVVIIATPVDTISKIAIEVLNIVKDSTLVFDAGSVKAEICKRLETHPKRQNFLAAHPIAGTEFSGPEAAIKKLFEHKTMILCDVEQTNEALVKNACSIFANLGMELKFMTAKNHDKHMAYVSHLSHVSSFMLGKTVLEIEKDEQNIFDLAGSGFESTVRLAKSSPNTWTPIFVQNKENVLRSLDEYIKNLIEFKEYIVNNDTEKIHSIMAETNHLKEVLKGISKKQQHVKNK